VMAAFGRLVPVARLSPSVWVVVASVTVTVVSVGVTLVLGRIPVLKAVVQ